LEKVGSHKKKAINLNQQNQRTHNHNHRHKNKWMAILIFGNVAKKQIEATIHAKEIWKFLIVLMFDEHAEQGKWKGRWIKSRFSLLVLMLNFIFFYEFRFC